MNTLPLLILFNVVATTLICTAQVPIASNDTPNVRLMSWSGNLYDLLLRDGSGYLRTDANEFVLGRPITLNNLGDTLDFFREVEIEGTLKKHAVAKVDLPEGTKTVLVVLAPAPAGSELPLRGQALDQSLEAHPLNTMRLVNFSSRTLAMRVAESTEVIGPGGEWIVPFPDEGSPQLAMAVAVDDAVKGWTLVQSSMQSTPRGRRVLGLVRNGRPDMGIEDPNMRTKLVDAIFIVDRAPPLSRSLER